MFNGSNCDRKSQLSGILTEPFKSTWVRTIDKLYCRADRFEQLINDLEKKNEG